VKEKKNKKKKNEKEFRKKKNKIILKIERDFERPGMT